MSTSIESAVIEAVHSHTLYDRDQLSPDAHLEGELGIDSVLLSSIVTSLRDKFRLGRHALEASPTTIRDLVDAVEAEVERQPATSAPTRAPSPGDFEAVVETVVRHTHYPREQILVDADLEGELGIDSVVLTSICGDLRNKLELVPGQLDPARLRTVRDIVEAIGGSVAPGVTAPPAHPTAAPHEPQQSVAPIPPAAPRVPAPAPRPQPVNVPRPSQPNLHTHAATPHAPAYARPSASVAAVQAATAAAIRAQPSTSHSDERLGDLMSHDEPGEPREPRQSGGGRGRPAVLSQPTPPAHARPAAPYQAPAPYTSGTGNGASQSRLTSSNQAALESLIATCLGTVPSRPDAPFSVQGVDETTVRKLHGILAEQMSVRPALKLEDCDTLEKLARYVDAAGPHALHGLVEGQDDFAPVRADTWDGRTMKDFVEQRDRDLFAKVRSFKTFYADKSAQQLYWYGMALETRCENRAVIYDEQTGRRREFLMFASNNYLGLANDPRVIEAIQKAAADYGATNTGCRLIGGTNVLHNELERRLAKFKKREACIVYPSGYSANLGCISALVKRNDAVVIDKLNHMSIIDGCKLSGGAIKIYQHNDMADLERVLDRASHVVDGMLIATDGVFSMHGNICNLPELVRLAKKYGAKVLVDDAHSTGVLGATGSGTAEHFGMKGEVDLELGTMSKTLAGLGGFVCGDADVIEYLRFYSNSYVFAANIPAAVAAGLIESIDIIEKEPERIERLWQNIRRLQHALGSAGFDLGGADSAIVPVVIGDDRKTLELGRAVRARGMFCQTVVYPGVSVGDARLRISISSLHTDEDMDLAAQIVCDAAKEVGVYPTRVV